MCMGLVWVDQGFCVGRLCRSAGRLSQNVFLAFAGEVGEHGVCAGQHGARARVGRGSMVLKGEYGVSSLSSSWSRDPRVPKQRDGGRPRICRGRAAPCDHGARRGPAGPLRRPPGPSSASSRACARVVKQGAGPPRTLDIGRERVVLFPASIVCGVVLHKRSGTDRANRMPASPNSGRTCPTLRQFCPNRA